MAVPGGFVAGQVLTAAELNAGTGGAWPTWSPTYTNFTLGNGTAVARYRHFGRTCRVQVDITLGSTSVVSGLIGISRPVTAAVATSGSAIVPMVDSGTDNPFGVLFNTSTTRFDIYPVNAASTYGKLVASSGSVPMTWVTNDRFFFECEYETAADGAA